MNDADTWPWPNGVPGFAAFDDQLRLRSTTAQYPALFGDEGGGVNLGFAKCPYCHEGGPILATDEMAPALASGARPQGFTAAEVDFVNRLFPSDDDVLPQLLEDGSRYFNGKRAACVRGCASTLRLSALSALAPLTADYLTTVSTEQAALRLDMPPELFIAIARQDPEVAAALPATDAIAPTDFARAFGALRQAAINLGADAAALNFCAVPEGG
jgi:hypothetical protein